MSQRLSKAADWVAELLNPVKGVQAARATLASALETAKAAADPDVAVTMGTDAWNRFAAHPAVAKLLSTAEPATSLGYQAFVQLHDTLVVSPASVGTVCFCPGQWRGREALSGACHRCTECTWLVPSHAAAQMSPLYMNLLTRLPPPPLLQTYDGSIVSHIFKVK